MAFVCSVDGCGRGHKARGYCSVHYQQLKRGAPITAEIAERGRYDGLMCSAVGCDLPIKAHGLCKKHYARKQRHGDPEYQRSTATCSADGCDDIVHAKELCTKHYYRSLRTGSTDDPVVRKAEFERCTASGCLNQATARGMCQTHYKRWQRHEHILDTRQADWGSREKHPLYSTWNAMMRYHRHETCERWLDLWNFVTDIGDSRPSGMHKLARKDAAAEFGPDNFYWRQPVFDGAALSAKGEASDRARKWRVENPDRAMETEYRRRYGIGFDDYARMFIAQHGVCAICSRAETRVDHRTKKISRLAVDHDHKTGAVRSLLCHSCNNGLGALGDDPDRIRAALAYLARHSRQPIVPILAADGSPRDYLQLLN